MSGLNNYQILFVLSAFLLQLILITHFALRKWRFAVAIRYGPIVYALGIPAAILSLILLRGGLAWAFWLGGFLYLIWSIYGYIIDYVLRVEWRISIRWSVLVPFIVLYLATVMFYWWPLGLIYKPLWYIYAVLFFISTWLNVTSHKKPDRLRQVTNSGKPGDQPVVR